MAESKTQTVRTGPYLTKVTLAGSPDRRAVLLLHGGGPGATALGNWSRTIEDLAEHFYVVAPDILGFGDTEHPDPPPRSLLSWMGLRVEQMLALIRELDLRDVRLVGNSMGGALSLHLLIEAPEQFGPTVLMGSAGAPGQPSPELIRMLRFYDDPRLGRFREIMRSFVYDPEAVPGFESMVEARYEVAVRPDIARSFQAMYSGPPQGVTLPPSVLAKLPQPVLLIHGRQDRIVLLQDSLYFLEHLRSADLFVFDRSGHWVNLERWDAMLPLVVQFLQQA